MKRVLITLLLLSSTISLASVRLTGKVKSGNGSLFNGKVVVTLPVATQDTNLNEAVCPCQFEFPVQNGTFPANANVVATSIMSPSNVYYIMQFFDPYGRLSMTLNAANIIEGSGTYDIGQATPTAITTAQISYITPASLSANQVWTGNNTFSQPIISTVATGTPPATIASTTSVPNLGASHIVSDNSPVAVAGLPLDPIRLGSDDRLCWRDSTNAVDVCLLKFDQVGSTFDLIGQLYGGTFTPFGLGLHSGTRSLPNGTGLVSNSNIEASGFFTPTGNNHVYDANNMAVGDVFFMHASGILTNTSGGNITYTARIKLDVGGPTLCQSAGVVVASGATAVPWKIDCTVFINTLGAGGTMDASGIYTINATSGDIANAALIAIDTTVVHTPLNTMQMSVANANGSFTSRTFYTYRVRY